MKKPRRAPTVRQADELLERARRLFLGRATKAGFVDIDLNAAMIQVKRALLLRPENFDALLLLGDILSELDEPQSLNQGLIAYDKAIAVEPDNPEGYMAKARTLLERGQAEIAEKVGRKALALARRKSVECEDREEAYQLVADALIKLERPREAVSLLKEGVDETKTGAMRELLKNYRRYLDL